MPGIPREPHPRPRPVAEHDAEALRQALLQVRSVISSAEGILHAASKAGCTVPISRSGLEQFMARETIRLASERHKPLEEFLFRSPLGRALRSPAINAVSAYDRLTAVLTSGNHTRPADKDVTGLYFVYHGSYILRGHFAVRLMEIRCLDESILTVTDYIRDNVTLKKNQVLKSNGCLIFDHDLPHIIVECKDNREGLCLIVGDETFPVKNEFAKITGTMLGMTKHSHYFFRYCIIVKQPAAISTTATEAQIAKARKLLIDETGVFTLEQLKGKHREAIDDLAKCLPEQVFSDPILDHPGAPKSIDPVS